MFKGKAFELLPINNEYGDRGQEKGAQESGFVELIFDLEGESVNKFNKLAMAELTEVLAILENSEHVKGMLFRSGKPAFVVGADIMEFGSVFVQGEQAVKDHLEANNASFNRLEDLPFPTVVAVNGFALGGGTEVCLACDYRIASESAKMGLPETKLGIIPGWGGTVRLPRIAGVDVAIDWIASGKEQGATKALADGVVDGVVEESQLRDQALAVLHRAAAGELDYTTRRTQKKSALRLNDMESLLSFESSKAFVKGKAGRNYPAPVAAIQAMQTASKYVRADALNVERDQFAQLAHGDVAQALVGLFVGDQALTKKAKAIARTATQPVNQAAVIGAGIMGGGIAYQSAYKGTPIVMKDITAEGLHLGIDEASKLLASRVDRGRMSNMEMAQTLARIQPSLSYDGFGQADIVVEAVVENLGVKQGVNAEAEQHVSADTVICSNTSTISITKLSESLERPENFCGMHFFNPVHRMPLVEVIRGEKTADDAIARTVAYANSLGKKAIVVNDCPGFLVNRVLFPYFAGFSMLLRDGADFQQVDKVMERWGWPMGPAYLMDVVGIDTGIHAEKVMAEGYPERMTRDYESAVDLLYGEGRLGQKTGLGFYAYETDAKGKQQKVVVEETYALLNAEAKAEAEFSDDEIVARMMVPMALEVARCLDEGIVSTANEADLALIYGLGFPPFRGGIFRWIDSIGLENFIGMASKFSELGPQYKVPDFLTAQMKSQSAFYPLTKQ